MSTACQKRDRPMSCPPPIWQPPLPLRRTIFRFRITAVILDEPSPQRVRRELRHRLENRQKSLLSDLVRIYTAPVRLPRSSWDPLDQIAGSLPARYRSEGTQDDLRTMIAATRVKRLIAMGRRLHIRTSRFRRMQHICRSKANALRPLLERD